MGVFQSEQPIHVTTLVASAALVAGDPVTAAGAKATGVPNFVGVANTDAAIGEAVPVTVAGIVAVKVDSASAGVAVGDRVTYVTNGYDTAGINNGFARALDAGVAGGIIRILLGHASAA